MNFIAKLAYIAFAFAMTACSGGSDPEGAAGTTTFDGEVLRLALPREGGGTERFSSIRDEWFSWTWRPFLPNHAGRRWAMIKSHTEGTALAYALVSGDNDNPTDYLAAGYWLWFPGTDSRLLSLSAAEPNLFMDGPEIGSANLADMGVSGTATYVGEVGGVYRYHYGSGWNGVDEREFAEEFGGPINITADFSDNTVTGCIGCLGDLEVRREHLYTLLRRRVAQPLAQPTDHEIHFGKTPIGANGTFESLEATVTHPTRTIMRSGGYWSGSFSNRPDVDGNPRLVAGVAEAAFEEADGSEGSFQGIFIGVAPSLRPPAARQ